jgi:hypothetical protein
MNRGWYSARCPQEFTEAIERATEDGTLDEWSWGALIGKHAPPGTREWERVHKRTYAEGEGLKRLA